MPDTLQAQAAAAPPAKAPTWLDAIKLGIQVEPPLSVLEKLKAERQPTAGESVQGFGANLARGAAEVPLQTFLEAPAILGAAIVKPFLPAGTEPTPLEDTPLGSLAQKARGALPEAPEAVQRNPSFLNTTLPSAIGSTAGFAATGGLGGTAGVAITGALSQGASAYQEAKGRHADDDTALLAFALSLPVGASEALPLGHLFARINKASGGGFGRILSEMAVQSAEEGAQELGQGALQNLIAQHTGDEDRKILDGLAEQGAAGAVVGALFGAGGAAISRLNERGANPETDRMPGASRSGKSVMISALPGAENAGAPLQEAQEPRAPDSVIGTGAAPYQGQGDAEMSAAHDTATTPPTSTSKPADAAPTLLEALKAHVAEMQAEQSAAQPELTVQPEASPQLDQQTAPADQVVDATKMVPAQPFGDSEQLPAPDKVAEIRSRRAALIAELGRKSKGTARATGLDPETLAHIGKIAATYVEEGVAHFETFAKETVEAIGEHVKPYLESAWAAATGSKLAEAGTNEPTSPPSEPPTAAAEPQDGGPAGFDLPDEGRMRRLYTGLVDDLERIKQAERIAPGKVQGEKVAETLQLAPGRRFGESEKLEKRTVRPLQRMLKSAGIPPIESTPDSVSASDYLYALHTPDSPVGTGMAPADAAALVAQANASPQAETYAKLREWNRKLNVQRLDTLEEGGLISGEERKAWEEKFGPDYVPTRSVQDPAAKVFGGASFAVSGPESKARKGRSSKADSPLVFSLVTAQQAIERAQRNKVGLKLAELVEANPAGPWRIETDANEIKENETALRFKREGVQHFIVTDDKALADAFKQIQDPQPGVLRVLDPLNRWLHKVIIQWNPVFPLTNVPRDIGTAAIKSLITGDYSASLGALKSALPASKGAFRALRSEEATGRWEDVYRRARDAGALIGWTQPQNFEERAKDFEKAVGQRSKAKAFGDLMSDLNTATELGTRLTVFDALTKAGKTEQQAAVGARRVTADFARKGRWAPIYRRLYLFSGANVQGSAEMAEAIAKNPRRAAAILGTITGAGFMMAALSYAYGDPEELEKLSEESKARFFGVMIGKRRYGVAAPYGFNLFPYLGWKLYETTMEDASPRKSLGDVTRAALDSFSPLPQGANMVQSLTPSVARPFVEISQNRDFGNRPIAPEVDPFDPSPPPNVDRAFRSVSTASKGIAQGLYAGSGEAIDVSPEWIDHLAKAASGGLGTFAGRMTDAAGKFITGDTEDLRISDIPFARPFVQEAPLGGTSGVYYEHRSALNEAKDRQKAGRSLDQRQLTILGLEPELKRTEKALKKLRAEAKEPDTTEARQKQIVTEIEEEQRAFNALPRPDTKKP